MLKNTSFVMTSLGYLLLLTAMVVNLSDFLSGFLLAISIILSITFYQD